MNERRTPDEVRLVDCSRCGEPMPDEAPFCAACGAPRDPGREDRRLGTWRYRVVLIGTALAVILVVGFLSFASVRQHADDDADGSGNATAPASATAGPERSISTYTDACIGCHGMQGSGNLGPRLRASAVVAHMSDKDLQELIELGKGDQMPGWRGRLTSDDVDSVIALLRSWQ